MFFAEEDYEQYREWLIEAAERTCIVMPMANLCLFTPDARGRLHNPLRTIIDGEYDFAC